MSPIAESLYNPYHSWDFMLWTDILVCPIVEDSLKRTVEFPKGNDWIDWWNASLVYTGGSSKDFTVPLTSFPVFHRKGSIVPLFVDTDTSLHGDSMSSGYLTVLIHPDKLSHEFTVRHWKKPSQDLSYSWEQDEFIFTASKHSQEVIVLLRSVKCPAKVFDVINDVPLNPVPSKSKLHFGNNGGFYCDHNRSQVYIKPSSQEGGVRVVIGDLRLLWD
eukprot:TRINITY_DN2783_c0_g1_i3.p1 TRINITY_DN2783_c0_g1~~TRINITY_DN2783_c0_g1_i3.p1  ORF type:complete len:217 (-),score=23.67 TRINITY_DN2783_c0_g1_i3:69-719(-)